METAGLVALALALGIVVGAGAATVIVLAARTGRRAVAAQSVILPSGIDAIIDVLEAPAVLLDPSGMLVTASENAGEAGLLDGGVHPDIRAIAAEVRSEGEPIRRDIVLHGSGRPDPVRHLSVTASLVGARYVLVIADDRSESVRLDEVRRDFVANISHELKTPIGAVSLLAEAIDSAAEDPAQVRRFAARLGGESRRLADMTHDIIELSRVQGLAPLAQSEPVRIDRVVQTAIEQNRVSADAKGIEILSRLPKERLTVKGHDLTLVAAVANLIANAVQYSPERSRVGVGLTRRDATIEIAVTDQGPGIPEDEQERIFERFFRSDPARSRNTGGSGLGLAIVKHAVANHGGSTRVWSQPGSGSTFTIVLPLADVIEELPTPTAHEGATA
ncbi:MAG TPA: ATP-binding protein [Microbacteriaceae bacterium]|nr:ATP-binding protein [Microbacteriaceae bacterium]